MFKFSAIAIAVLSLGLSSVVFASDDASKTVEAPAVAVPAPWLGKQTEISFNVSARKKVPYDLLSVTFRTEGQGNSRKAAYELAKKELSPVLSLLNEFPASITSNNFVVMPLRDYKDKAQKIVGYQYQYSVTLESMDFTSLMQLADTVSGTVSVNNLSYRMSAEKEEDIKSQLMGEVVEKAKRRATALSFSLESDNVSLRRISFNPGTNFGPAPLPAMSMMKAGPAGMADSVLPPLATETEVEVEATVSAVVR